MKKALHKSRTDRMVAGVCGGLAEYFGLDATLIRIVWAVMILMAGSGLPLYIVCAIIIPNDTDGYYNQNNYQDNQRDSNGWY